MESNASEILEEHAQGKDHVRAMSKELLIVTGGVRSGLGLLIFVTVQSARVVRPMM